MSCHLRIILFVIRIFWLSVITDIAFPGNFAGVVSIVQTIAFEIVESMQDIGNALQLRDGILDDGSVGSSPACSILEVA